jgi:hypothetical protein
MLLAIRFLAILWAVTGYAKRDDSRFEDRREKKIAGCNRISLVAATISARKRARLQPAFII